MRIERGEFWEMRLGKWQDSAPAEVDVVIGDPPYDEETHTGARRQVARSERDGQAVEEFEIPFDPLSLDDVAELATRVVHTAKRWTVLFCAVEQLGDYRRSAGGGWQKGGEYVRAGAFVKRDATPQFSGDRPATWGDGIAIMHNRATPGRMHWNGGGHSAIYYASRAYRRKVDAHHPTEKPLSLMRKLVKHYSDPGELVWDPFAGSATTGVACLTLGRRFIGHEMDETHFETAVRRLRAAEHSFDPKEREAGQTALFEPSLPE